MSERSEYAHTRCAHSRSEHTFTASLHAHPPKFAFSRMHTDEIDKPPEVTLHDMLLRMREREGELRGLGSELDSLLHEVVDLGGSAVEEGE